MLVVSIQLVCFASNCLFRTMIRKLIVAEICAYANDWHAEQSCAWAKCARRYLAGLVTLVLGLRLRLAPRKRYLVMLLKLVGSVYRR